jgi:phosphopantothenoylcysteine decarboxylase
MARVLLGVTGSVAAIKTPELVRALIEAGHEVKVVATPRAVYFFDPESVPPGILIRDEDEWPRISGSWPVKTWQRTDPVLHIELRRWAELFLVAPLDANTLAKMSFGLCDNCLTCVWRSWDLARPIILAPAMNTLMWQHPQTIRQFRELAAIWHLAPPPDLNLPDIVQWINAKAGGKLSIAGPIEKMLACGDLGMGAMTEVAELVREVSKLYAYVNVSAEQPLSP